MPDASSGTVAFLNGGEIVNDARTIVYLENGFGPGTVKIDGSCVCPNIRELIDCGSAPYKSPALDPAPWYDVSIPESADFAGFLTHDFTGLGSTYTRQKTDKISGGSVLGRLRPQSRTLVWKGYLFGKSECAVHYGLQWLTANLVGTGCDCGGEDLDILVCCPDLKDTPKSLVCTTSPWVWNEAQTSWIGLAGRVPSGYSFPVPASTTPNIGPLLGFLAPFGEVDVFGASLDFNPQDFDYSQHHINWVTTNNDWQNPASAVPGTEGLWVVVSGPNFSSADPPPPFMPSTVVTGVFVSVADGIGVAKPLSCPPFDQPDAFRTLKNVGLIDGPKILSQRKIGCCSDKDCSTCGESSLIIEVEFSLLCGNPYLYGCDVCLGAEQSFPVPECQWEKITDAEAAIILAARALVGDTSTILCPPAVCHPQPDCTVDPFCTTATLPPAPTFTDKCFCDPMVPTELCFSVPADSFSAFFDGVPIIEIFSGATPMRATTIRFFQNAKDLPCCTAAEDPCLNCASMQIRYIPKNSTMVIDGTTRQVTVQCPGAVVPEIADHLVGTFTWPVLQCTDFCICIETEGISLAPDATVSVLVTPREM